LIFLCFNHKVFYTYIKYIKYNIKNKILNEILNIIKYNIIKIINKILNIIKYNI